MMKDFEKQIKRLEAANAKKEALLLAKAAAEDSDCEKDPPTGCCERHRVWCFKADMASVYFHEELEAENMTATYYFVSDRLSECFSGHPDFKFIFHCYVPETDSVYGCISFKTVVSETLLRKRCGHLDYEPTKNRCEKIVTELRNAHVGSIKHQSGVLRANNKGKWDFMDFFGIPKGTVLLDKPGMSYSPSII